MNFRTLTALSLLFASTFSIAQELDDPNYKWYSARIEYLNYFSLYQPGPELQMPGITFGLSTRIGDHWIGYADYSIAGTNVDRNTGYTRVRLRALRMGIDLYFNQAYRGFFIGAGMGYNWLNESQEEGSTSEIGLPNSHAIICWGLGYTMRVNDKLNATFRFTNSQKPSAGDFGSLELRLGLGYRF
ncbi:MAG: outer membrane beta-barrel protein [Flavobacteriia bacterium]|nr:outer membrane beta-barrel protein [Flavobacteriia bacterium]